MPPLPDLLAPIPGALPAGPDLRYDPVMDQIKEARREDDPYGQGDWQRTRKTADWPLVIKLASEFLSNRSKDLQVAVWLTEALLRRDGFGGLRSGLGLLGGLLDQYWDGLHPEMEDGDPEARIGPLEWVGAKLDVPARQVPLNRQGHDILKYAESRSVGSMADAEKSDDPTGRVEAYNKAKDAGKLTAEAFDQSVDATPKETYPRLVADLEACLDALQRLDQLGRVRFGHEAPGYGPLRAVLEEVLRVARQLRKRVGLEPAPAPEEPAQVPANLEAASGPLGATQSVPAGNGAPALAPQSGDEAAARLASAATFLRRSDPRSPAPYLVLRGFRWGELRGIGGADPRLLEAPATPVRTRLKGLLLDRQWQELLEAAERVMETPQGRGWLDLQRYAVTACEGLGPSFHPVADAIRGELRALLSDLPGLPEMTLMDDTPAANAETRTWLSETVLQNGEASAAKEAGEARQPAVMTARSGGPERAIQTILRELDRETSRRGRFLRQTELAGVMVEADLAGVAKPILEELLAQIDAHKLEEWETGDLVARPLALLYRCLDKLGTDSALKESLYLRVCRLDPLQAIGFARA